jgi:hypothetical protein
MKKRPSFLEVVKYIYVYFFSAIGTIMIIVGIYQFGEYVFKSSFGPDYRLEPYQETQCDYIDGMMSSAPQYPVPMEPVMIKEPPQVGEEDIAEKKQKCLENLARERLYQEKRDLFNASMLAGLGLLVFVIHFGWMREKFLNHE